MNPHNPWLLAATLAVAAHPAAADEAVPSDTTTPVQLDAVIVTGTAPTQGATATKTDTPVAETPQSISVIDRESLDARNVQSLNQALRYVPGIQSEQYGIDNVYDFFSVRGFAANLTGVFRDGLQLLSPSSGFAAFRLEPYGVEHIEVLRGPASGLYGGTNPGGLVNYVSKRPTAAPEREVALEVGSYDWRQAKFDFSGPLAPTLQYRLTGLVREAGTQVDFEQNDRRFIAPALSWQLSANTNVTLLAQYQKDDAGHLQFLPPEGTVAPNPNGRIPVSRNDGEPGYNGFDREQWSAGWLLEHRFSPHWSARQQLRYDDLQTAFRDVFGLALDPADPSQRTLSRGSFSAADQARAVGVDSSLIGKLGRGQLTHTVLAGIDYQHNDYEGSQGFDAAPSIDIFTPTYGAAIAPPPLFTDTRTRQQQVGLYLQEQARFDERWLLLLGGRQDFVDAKVDDRLAGGQSQQDDQRFTGRAGVSYRFDAGLLPYASYATSFLPVLGSDANGQRFKPETGEQWEGGLKFENATLRGLLTLAAFHIDRENVRTPAPDNPLAQVQTGAVRSQGIELGLDAKPLPGLRVTGAYTWQDVEVTRSNAGNEGLRPVATPEHLGSLRGDYELREGALAGLGFGLGLRYQGASPGDDLNSFESDAYTLLDAGLHYQWRGVRLALDAQNLTDKTYVAACQSGACFYGVARTVTGSVAYRW